MTGPRSKGGAAKSFANAEAPFPPRAFPSSQGPVLFELGSMGGVLPLRLDRGSNRFKGLTKWLPIDPFSIITELLSLARDLL